MKMKHILALVSLLGTVVVASAQAEEFLDNRWYAAPFGSYVHTGGDRGADDGWGAGLSIGKILNEHFNVELRGFYNEYEAKSPNVGDWQSAGGSADVMYYFTRNKFAPYTVFGLGGMHTEVGSFKGASFIGEAGAGFTYEVTDNFLVRSDIRYRYNHNFDQYYGRNTDQFSDMVLNVGFVVPFGPKPVAEAAFEVPAPTPVPDCSTLDDDNDGVNNCDDQCPHTLAGSKVDYQGCHVSLELKGVNFKYDSAELTDDAMYILDTVADNLIQYPDKHDIEVRGHTSSEGTSAYNLNLSQRRSQSVVDYLKMKGVTNNLIAHGMGEDYPIADNSTEEGRSANRRVELIWMGE